MKARIKNTGEIIEVVRLTNTTYGRLDVAQIYRKDMLDFDLSEPKEDDIQAGITHNPDCPCQEKENDCVKFTKTLDDALEVETADSLNEWINSRNVPKLKVGQLAMFKGRKVEIIGYSDHYPQLYRVFVLTENYYTDVEESDLEPDTAPEEDNRNLAQ